MTLSARHRQSRARSTPQATRRPRTIVARGLCAHRRRGASSPDWITLSREEAAVARARKLAHRRRGPLYGIPFAVKDNIDVAGLPTTCACPEFAYVPERRADGRRALEQAGAILIGKTNLDQFATGLNGTRSPYGVPRQRVRRRLHFRRLELEVRRSRSRRGLCRFALGTDTAGSGRVPAAFNNIVGLKPTKGADQHARRGACLPDAGLRLDLRPHRRRRRARSGDGAVAFDAEDPFSARRAALRESSGAGGGCESASLKATIPILRR